MIDSTARLISISYVGALGVAQRTETETPIFCDISSVQRAEFFAAYNSGFRPEYRVTTNPVNYSGETVIDLDTPGGTVRCDIYRTYRKSLDILELWCCRQNPEAVQVFTLWTAGKKVVLHGAYLTGSDAAARERTGSVATDNVALILPQTLQAFVGETPVAYCRPKAYEAMSAEEKAEHFYIDVGCFFALGEPQAAADAKYQAVNAAFDDVWRVSAVTRKNRGKPDTEYLEVTGR